jgi:hypothetical protein
VTAPKAGTVYALVDPRDNCARYVGATTQTLKARLRGHLRGPTARRVKAWIDGLAADGVTPRIEALHEDVPEANLRALETAEITRRLIAGEHLLNESGTAQGRRHIERQQELDRIERERAAWEHAANQVRAVLGGPLTPGDVAAVPLSRQLIAAYHDLMRAEDDLGPKSEVVAGREEYWTKASSLHMARAEASDALWLSVRALWGSLRGMASERFDDVLAARVGKVFQKRWDDPGDVPRYLALLPWGIVAVGPWAALAERAGMDTAGTAFVDWVSDDPAVREALMVLLVRADGRMGPLSVLDNDGTFTRPSTGLVAMTAAHCPGFDLPQELHREVKEFLRSMARDGQITPAMGDLFLKLEPDALNKTLGPNIAADIDTHLGLPAGTSRAVLAAVVDSSPGLDLDRLDRIAARATGAFPTVTAPDFRRWVGNTVPMLHAIVGSLVEAGLLEARDGRSPSAFVSEVRSLWVADPGMPARSA